MLESEMNKDEVISHIRNAFSSVELGSGIGLWQAQAIDDYETEETQQQKRLKDKKENWQSFSSKELQRCHSSLSFFDADGMRFHLPAFIIGSLTEDVDDPVFHLSHLQDYSKSQFSSLNKEQVSAVVIYLQWCAENPDFAFEKPTIQRALNDYWASKL